MEISSPVSNVPDRLITPIKSATKNRWEQCSGARIDMMSYRVVIMCCRKPYQFEYLGFNPMLLEVFIRVATPVRYQLSSTALL